MKWRTSIFLRSDQLRRFVFFASVGVIFGIGVWCLCLTFSPNGFNSREIILSILFIPLFLQLAFGTVLASAGYIALVTGDPFRLAPNPKRISPEGDKGPPTAIIIPIFNEDVPRVFRGIRSMLRSLAPFPQSERFDFFILSDTNDPNYWIEEETSWLELCKEVQGFGRIFYRKRQVALNQKSGNVADFCRRWGANYRYMIVLDADSIMTGAALIRLVELMESHPSAGIIQAVPRQVRATSLFARIQQFAVSAYGPIFVAGSHFWHLSRGTYWGHNAIIRLEPFIKNCALPELPKSGPFTGRILSHDSIEAALMLASGYDVWLAYDIEGSYEEGPPDLLSSLQRDRRWCLGNLQHLTFLFKRGLRLESRLHLLLGIMAYVSAALWFAFIALTLGLAFRPDELGSVAPASVSVLFGLVIALLLIPKYLSVAYFWKVRRKSSASEKPIRFFGSVLLEIVFSTLLASIQMVYHTYFVLCAILRIPTYWTTQNRNADELPWKLIRQRMWWLIPLTVAMGAAAWIASPAVFWWLSPILIGWILALPMARLTSSPRWGDVTRQWGLFVTPEEAQPDPVLKLEDISLNGSQSPFFLAGDYRAHFGLLKVILDPYVNALHVALLRSRSEIPVETSNLLAEYGSRLMASGPAALTAKERTLLLWHSEPLIKLHRELWSAEAGNLADWWIQALRHYNEMVALDSRRRMT